MTRRRCERGVVLARTLRARRATRPARDMLLAAGMLLRGSLCALALAGCAAGASYVYAPQGTTTWTDGYLSATAAVPPEAPQGRVDIASFGVVELQPNGVGPVAALHLRLAITNDGDATPWTLDTNEQFVEIAGAGRSRPIYVNTDRDSLPTVTIAQREVRIVDCYYPLPPEVASNDTLPEFDVLWQVQTAARLYATRTRFRRVAYEPPTAGVQVMYEVGWGPYWWFDPFYERAVIVGHHAHAGRVIVTRAPHWHRSHRRPR